MERKDFDHWPAGVPKTLPPVTHTLNDNLARAAKASPDKTALIFYGATKTYAALDAEVTRIAAYLQAVCHVAKGDRVGIYMQNSLQFVAAFYGVIRAGGIVVPVNAMHKTDELSYTCENAQVRTLFTSWDLVANVAPLIEAGTLDHVIAVHYSADIPARAPIRPPETIAAPAGPLPADVVDWADLISGDYAFAPVHLAPEDTCVLPYTSGSTGRGKGCVHTHKSTLHAVACMTEWFKYLGDEVHLGATPMFHIVGMQGIMNASISMGATIVIMARWDREAAARLIAEYGVTTWSTVPTAVIDLLNSETVTADDLASMRLIYGGGSAMPEAIAERLADLTGLEFVEVFGMTETMGPVTHNSMDRPKTGCVGIPVMNTDLMIVDPDTLTPVAVGEVGEILVSGPQVMTQYWKNLTSDAETLITLAGKQFLRTGDLAKEDTEGNIYIVDRLKRMINASGYKVWPAEVEARLYQHPAIAEVCVIGANDDYRGEAVKAVAVLKTGATLDTAELANWAKGHMAAYKVPRLMDVVESLPKSAAGKVLWRQLQDEENAKSLS